jgi:hypothetical protein
MASDDAASRSASLPGLLSTHYFLAYFAQVAFAFEKHLVYQKAVDRADRIAAKTETFPRGLFLRISAALTRTISCRIPVPKFRHTSDIT